MVTQRGKSALKWGVWFAFAHGLIVTILIPLRVTYWGAFGSSLGRIQHAMDFFLDGIVRRTGNTLSPIVQWFQHTTGMGIGKVAVAFEVLSFVFYGGLAYFLLGFLGRAIYLRCRAKTAGVDGSEDSET